jgi:hypothetical protein
MPLLFLPGSNDTQIAIVAETLAPPMQSFGRPHRFGYDHLLYGCIISSEANSLGSVNFNRLINYCNEYDIGSYPNLRSARTFPLRERLGACGQPLEHGGGDEAAMVPNPPVRLFPLNIVAYGPSREKRGEHLRVMHMYMCGCQHNVESLASTRSPPSPCRVT